jgi:hypothetical protein
MKTAIYGKKNVNTRLTKTIIQCHEAGYTEDFVYNGPGIGITDYDCPQVIHQFFTATVIDMGYDTLAGEYKYIYTIVTNCGRKGILVANRLPIS